MVLDYDQAIERYKLYLFNTIVKKEERVRKHIPVWNFPGCIVEKGEELKGTDPETLGEKN